jgi:hypothetical protein
MTRQYRIFYKRHGSKGWSTLVPHVSANLYDNPQVTAAIQAMRDNPAFEAICVRSADELFNIVSFWQDAIAPQAFTF